MFAKFHKIGVASAVAAALGASGAANALILGEPGSALLIPHVIFDRDAQVNTLIGVTVASNLGVPLDIEGAPTVFNGLTTVFEENPTYCNEDANLHLYFFDVESIHRGDIPVPVTCEDFVRIDWGHLVSTRLPSLNGRAGYIVISDNNPAVRAGIEASGFALYGASYLIQGNWASQAFIPVVPLWDTVDATAGDEVSYGATVPDAVNPIFAGMDLAFGGSTDTALFSLRYFLDPVLSGGTRLVLWFPDNSTARNDIPINVYDCDENPISTSISVPDELNVIDAATIDGTIHTVEEESTATAIGSCVNTGFVEFAIADGAGASGPRAGVAFSLVAISGGVNAAQVQTELAHERGVVVGVTGAAALAP